MSYGPIGAGLLYFFMLAGSVSIGYLLIRLAAPAVRTIPVEQRLGAAAVVGAAVVGVAMVMDGAVELDLFVQGNGRFALFSLVSSPVFFFILRWRLAESLGVVPPLPPQSSAAGQAMAAGGPPTPFQIEVIRNRKGAASGSGSSSSTRSDVDALMRQIEKPQRVAEPLVPPGYQPTLAARDSAIPDSFVQRVPSSFDKLKSIPSDSASRPPASRQTPAGKSVPDIDLDVRVPTRATPVPSASSASKQSSASSDSPPWVSRDSMGGGAAPSKPAASSRASGSSLTAMSFSNPPASAPRETPRPAPSRPLAPASSSSANPNDMEDLISKIKSMTAEGKKKDDSV